MSSGSKWIFKGDPWSSITTPSHSMALEEFRKSGTSASKKVNSPLSLLEDPLQFYGSMGYKYNRSAVSYEILKRIPQQLALISAVLQTRTNQVASFAVPYRQSKNIGFLVKHKDPSHATTEKELKRIKELEEFITNCGFGCNPNSMMKRDNFDQFLRKFVRDSLMFDQATFEIVRDRKGDPFEFYAVDSSTIRIASPHTKINIPRLAIPNSILYNANLRDISQKALENPAYVQVINSTIRTVYGEDDLVFGIRNPRSDVNSNGYGYSELEQLVTIITSHLYAEEYNKRFFTQGSAPKGILNFKGDAMSPDQLEAFRREWKATVEGVENSWRTPILQSEAGLDWIDLHPSNREMEYGQWLEYLIKITCAVFLIDPAELNFDMHGGVQQTPLFESSQEWKLKASRDRGLKPLLRFIASLINKRLINELDNRFVFEFSGLDDLTEKEKHTLRMEQVTSYKTLNEIRKSDDDPPLPWGDVPLNPTYLQGITVQKGDTRSGQDNSAASNEAEFIGEEVSTEDKYVPEFTKSLRNLEDVFDRFISEEE